MNEHLPGQNEFQQNNDFSNSSQKQFDLHNPQTSDKLYTLVPNEDARKAELAKIAATTRKAEEVSI